MTASFARKFVFVVLSLISWHVAAGNSVLISPIDPKIGSDDNAAELWIENRGSDTTLMQVRVFLWQQAGGREQFQTQQQVMASPSMVRIEPGKKQLIRLVRQVMPAAGKEQAYRILLDEIPTPKQPGQQGSGLNFQMRYSVPLFVYGPGLSAATAKPQLSWRLLNQNGKNALEISNAGSGHARLSDVTIGGRKVSEGLLGYVLAGSSNTFPVGVPASASGELNASLGNNKNWRSGASR